MTEPLDVLGIGNAIVDVLAHATRRSWPSTICRRAR